MILRARIEVAVARHAAETPEILTLEVGPVAPAEDLECNQILLAGYHELGKVELAFELAVLAVADKFAVDPQVDIRGHGAEMGDDLASLPRSRNLDLAPVRAYVIVLYGNNGRIVLILVTPSVVDVDIQRVAIAVQFPDTGDGHCAPGLVVEVRLPEIRRPAVCVRHPVELPESVQGHVVGGLFRNGSSGGLRGLV